MDSYRSAGLVRNPFVLEGPIVGDDVWLDRGFSQGFAQPQTLVQFIGDKGAGKTSHVRRWQSQLGGTYRHIAPGIDRFVTPPVVDRVVFWDEADRIPLPLLAFCLRFVAFRRGMIVAGTHRNLSEPALRAGLNVHTMTLDEITAQDVEEWARLRILSAAFDQPLAWRTLGPVPASVSTAPHDLSWRDIGDQLHSWAAQRVSAQHDRSVNA